MGRPAARGGSRVVQRVAQALDERRRSWSLLADETGGEVRALEGVEGSLVVEPTVLPDATSHMAAARNQQFGPIAPGVGCYNDGVILDRFTEAKWISL